MRDSGHFVLDDLLQVPYPLRALLSPSKLTGDDMQNFSKNLLQSVCGYADPSV